MKFGTRTAAPHTLATACLVIGVFENGVLPEMSALLDNQSNGLISRVLKTGELSGKPGSYLLLMDPEGIKSKRLLLVGCGKKKDLDLKKYQTVINNSLAALEKYQFKEALTTLSTLSVADTDIAARAALLARLAETASYRYTTTRTEKKPPASLTSLDICLDDRKSQRKARTGLEKGQAIGRGMNVARELGNLPGNICTPTYLGEQAIALGKKHKNLKVKVLGETQMKRLGMGALLSVSAGSDQPAAFIVMEYQGTDSKQNPDVIVGKGVTFDTGGISIKPSGTMDEMKFDMCGAASVLGTMQSICELQPKSNIIGIIASAENMPSGGATKPGDVVTSMSGQTIEILNTDAEGRLVLCDALTYVERYTPRSVVDIATLTGAIITALGSEVSGLMSNNDELAESLYKLGQQQLEPVWRLPLWDHYQKQLDSNFADMANIGGPKAGSITAACFLSRFAKKYPWAHLDIAGTAWLQGPQKGATGRPVPLLVEYLLTH